MTTSIPTCLTRLIESGRWRHPGDEALSRAIPFITDPLDFMATKDWIERESQGRLADRPDTAERFKEKRGSREGVPVDLPWRDVERSIIVAVNRNIGDDIAIALDFRTSIDDPRVIATAWSSDFSSCEWREVSPSFSQFLVQIGIDYK